MATVTVSEKGQVVIPADIRRKLGITAGTRLELIEDGAEIRVIVQRRMRETHHADGYGLLVYGGAPRRLADFDIAKAMRGERDR